MTLVLSVLEQGMIYAIMALGIYITYTILDFPDLTVDGSFPLGAALLVIGLVLGGSLHPQSFGAVPVLLFLSIYLMIFSFFCSPLVFIVSESISVRQSTFSLSVFIQMLMF